MYSKTFKINITEDKEAHQSLILLFQLTRLLVKK